tara:strand:- start:25 stop:744 length:720 start_codon:yes stop_codon:yes gene_type:complete
MDATTPTGETAKAYPKSIPDCCPVCNNTGTMAQKGGSYIRYRDGWEHQQVLQLTFRCPRHKCGALFLAEYDFSDGRGYGRESTWDLQRLYPDNPSQVNLQDCVLDISPSFAGLYKQAHSANFHGLKDVYGMALRKAFEFLIKDYCISKSPDDTDKIKKEFLGSVIKNRITDQNIKICAERATWLGNDETHYERRWTSHDVQDLHTLVKLVLNWITNEHLTQSYLDSMQQTPTKMQNKIE